MEASSTYGVANEARSEEAGAEVQVTDDDIAAYVSNGYVVVRGLFNPSETAALRSAGHEIIERLSANHDVIGTWESADRSGEATELFHCHDVQLHSSLFTRMLLDDRLTSAMSSLMGTPNVQLHHNKLFIKAPERGSPFPLHQDWQFFPHANETPMAAIVHLDEATEENGCLQVVPGSHSLGRMEHVKGEQFYLPDGAVDPGNAVPVPALPGDVLFFSYLTVHCSGVNRSTNPRTTWLIQVRDPADRPTEERHVSPGQGTMLRGVNSENAPGPTSL